jgi:hypothetical protein
MTVIRPLRLINLPLTIRLCTKLRMIQGSLREDSEQETGRNIPNRKQPRKDKRMRSSCYRMIHSLVLLDTPSRGVNGPTLALIHGERSRSRLGLLASFYLPLGIDSICRPGQREQKPEVFYCCIVHYTAVSRRSQAPWWRRYPQSQY